MITGYMKTYKMTNRYGDKFTFTPQEDGTILWEGNFEYCRFGWPNDYTEAYKKYYEEECIPPHDHTLSKRDFIEEVHRSIYDENNSYVGPSPIAKKYQSLVVTNKAIINMVDPSGGPYLASGMVIKEISDKEIERFESVEQGWKIYLK